MPFKPKKPNYNNYFTHVPGDDDALGGLMIWENRFLVIDPDDPNYEKVTTKTIKVIAKTNNEAKDKACTVIDSMLYRYMEHNNSSGTVYGRHIETRPCGHIHTGEVDLEKYLSNYVPNGQYWIYREITEDEKTHNVLEWNYGEIPSLVYLNNLSSESLSNIVKNYSEEFSESVIADLCVKAEAWIHQHENEYAHNVYARHTKDVTDRYE